MKRSLKNRLRIILNFFAIIPIWPVTSQAAQAHYVWLRASKVLWSEYTRIFIIIWCQISAKILKVWSLLVCLSVLVAFKITKVDISCIFTCDSGPYCSNFITCIRIYNTKKKKLWSSEILIQKAPLPPLPFIDTLCPTAGLKAVWSTFFPSSAEHYKRREGWRVPTDPRRAKANKFQTKQPISLKLPPARPKSVYLPVRREPVSKFGCMSPRSAAFRIGSGQLRYEIRILELSDRVRSTKRHSRGGGSLLLP